LRRQVGLRALLEKCLCFRHGCPTGGDLPSTATAYLAWP
jgi:hypothetical protein